MLQRLDKWIGKTLFIPLIIKICQKLRITQHCLANHLSMVAMMILCFHFGQYHWLFLVVLTILAVCEIIIAVFDPNYVMQPSGYRTRMIATICVIVIVVSDCLTEEWDFLLYAFYFCLVTADYAREIDTVPPAEEKEAKSLRAAPNEV